MRALGRLVDRGYIEAIETKPNKPKKYKVVPDGPVVVHTGPDVVHGGPKDTLIRDSSKIEDKKGQSPSASHDPTMTHQAIVDYRDWAKLTPGPDQREAIIAKVGDKTFRWKEFLRFCTLNRRNPKNIGNLLEEFERWIFPANGGFSKPKYMKSAMAGVPKEIRPVESEHYDDYLKREKDLLDSGADIFS